MADDIAEKILDAIQWHETLVEEVNDLLETIDQSKLTQASDKLNKYLKDNIRFCPDAVFASLVSACCAMAASRFDGEKESLILMINTVFDEMEQQGVLHVGRSVN